jgi:hypothetical protein
VASQVANATLTTPLLPGQLRGHGYLVSHGGAAFPDLDFVLQGDNVTLIQEGHTAIKSGITSSTFGSLPDAPFTSFNASFPVGPDSLLAANGSLCTRTLSAHTRVLVRKHGRAVREHGRLVYRTRSVSRQVPATLTMATTLVAQNGRKRTESTPIKVVGCGKRGVRGAEVLHPRVRVRGHTAFVTLALPSAGRLGASAPDVLPVHRRVPKAGTATLAVPLSSAGIHALGVRHRLSVRVRVVFTPPPGGGGRLLALATAVFRQR